MSWRDAPTAAVKTLVPNPWSFVQVGDGTVDFETHKTAFALEMRVVAPRCRVPTHGTHRIAVSAQTFGDVAAPEVVVSEQSAVSLVPGIDGFEVMVFGQLRDHIGVVDANFAGACAQIKPQRSQFRP